MKRVAALLVVVMTGTGLADWQSVWSDGTNLQTMASGGTNVLGPVSGLSGGGGGDVYTTSNNTFAAGSTNTMPLLVGPMGSDLDLRSSTSSVAGRVQLTEGGALISGGGAGTESAIISVLGGDTMSPGTILLNATNRVSVENGLSTRFSWLYDGTMNAHGNSLTNLLWLKFTSGWYLYAGGMGDQPYWSDGVSLNQLWTDSNDGAGSGLDADTLDGNDSANFATAGHDHDLSYDALGASGAASNGVIAQLVSSNWISHAAGAALYGSSNGVWTEITAGGVDPSITNGLAGTNWVDEFYYPRNNPSNWVAASITNPLPAAWGADITAGTGAVMAAAQSGWGAADTAVSNGVLSVVGSRGYVTNNQSGVAFGAITGSTVRATAAYTGGYMVGADAGGIFVPRSTAAAYDFAIGSGLTANGTYISLDLSDIVPSGAKAVAIRAYIKDNLSTSVFLVRRDSSSGVTGTLAYSSIVNTYMFVFAPVAISSNRTVEYTITSGTDEAGIVITGWFL